MYTSKQYQTKCDRCILEHPEATYVSPGPNFLLASARGSQSRRPLLKLAS